MYYEHPRSVKLNICSKTVTQLDKDIQKINEKY